METNEALESELRQVAEAGIQQLLHELQELPQADLQGLEQQVLHSSRRVGRSMLEVVLAHRTREDAAPVRRLGACGHPQHLVGRRPKEVFTLLGKVKWSRPYYRCQGEGVQRAESQREQGGRCHHGEAPADALLGVQGRRTSAGVQEEVSYLAAHMPLEDAAAAFSRLVPLSMSARQVLALLRPVGQALAAQEDEQVSRLWTQAGQARTLQEDAALGAQAPNTQQTIDRLYVELDGVMARLRRGSVEMEEKEVQRAGDVYREAKVGAVFEVRRGRERSGLAPGVWVDEPCKETMHYVARRSARGNFGPLLYSLAQQAGVERAKQVVVLGDGARWIWRLAEEHFPGAVHIVDVWHAQEHVWEVAHAVFGRSTPTGRTWAIDGCSLLVQGQIEELVHAIEALPPIEPEPGQTRSVPEKAIDYFSDNAVRMRYPQFRAQGMHVGSGIAEAACKTVVSSRAKGTGMRWTPEGLDAILPLRTAVLNSTFDPFWAQHHAVLT